MGGWNRLLCRFAGVAGEGGGSFLMLSHCGADRVVLPLRCFTDTTEWLCLAGSSCPPSWFTVPLRRRPLLEVLAVLELPESPRWHAERWTSRFVQAPTREKLCELWVSEESSAKRHLQVRAKSFGAAAFHVSAVAPLE